MTLILVGATIAVLVFLGLSCRRAQLDLPEQICDCLPAQGPAALGYGAGPGELTRHLPPPPPARRSIAARHPARPTKTTTPGCSHPASRATRSAPAPYSAAVRPSALGVARLTRSVIPTPSSASAASGSRGRVTTPAETATDQN